MTTMIGAWRLAGLALLFATATATETLAAPVELAINGGFQSPEVASSSGKFFASTAVPGWTSMNLGTASVTDIEIWDGDTFIDFPDTPFADDDQHVEVVGHNGAVGDIFRFRLFQEVLVPVDVPTDWAILAFDTWFRQTNGMQPFDNLVDLVDGSGASLIGGPRALPVDGLGELRSHSIGISGLLGYADQTLELRFESADRTASAGGTDGNSSMHLNNVSLLVGVSSLPQPSTFVLFGLGLAVLVLRQGGFAGLSESRSGQMLGARAKE